MIQFLITANAFLSTTILVTLKMEAIRFSKTSVLTRSARHNMPKDGVLHSRRCENLKSYKHRIVAEYPH
jgi:hypothetical protein